MTAAELQAAWQELGVDLADSEAAELADRITRQHIAPLYTECLHIASLVAARRKAEQQNHHQKENTDDRPHRRPRPSGRRRPVA
ncbi:hypothetical protein H7J50_04555 [Mycobacterium intermedium]|uniref:hypothetical protein n=1 Tax=Mycobacterium intermedium TaxID=28445 RepID=UPI000A86DDE0|nr:hypothetical protein [Mycobacterium intermedium]MCV6963080.1 hypothetical protein [Mycobacterium intermedium]